MAALEPFVLPTAIEKTPNKTLRITWSDGLAYEYPFRLLRASCPCATCREKRKAEDSKPKNLLNVLSSNDTIPLDVLQMKPVGNYAYNIAFSDGHSSGLFTMELLRSLGTQSPEPS
ncbi:MAG: DUF971 domain-containing protein [Planctomycetota bacterium]